MNFFTEFKTDIVSIANEFIDRFKNIPARGEVVLEQLPTAITGFVVVLSMLAIIAVTILVFSKVMAVLSNKKKPAEAPVAAPAAAPSAPAGTPLPADTSAGSLDLVDVDEKTAAVIMAIVSKESGIPLNRLAFKSIKKTEDK